MSILFTIAATFIIGTGIASLSVLWPQFVYIEYGYINHIWPVWLGFLIAMLGGIYGNAKSHARQIKEGKGLNNSFKKALKRSWVLIYMILFGGISEVLIWFILLGLVWFWIVFDPLINILMGWAWNYLGVTDTTDIIFDNWKEQYLVKLVLFIWFSFLLL